MFDSFDLSNKDIDHSLSRKSSLKAKNQNNNIFSNETYISEKEEKNILCNCLHLDKNKIDELKVTIEKLQKENEKLKTENEEMKHEKEKIIKLFFPQNKQPKNKILKESIKGSKWLFDKIMEKDKDKSLKKAKQVIIIILEEMLTLSVLHIIISFLKSFF